MKNLGRHTVVVVLALLLSFVFLSLFGTGLEDRIRQTYRKYICRCDTGGVVFSVDSNGVPWVHYRYVNGYRLGKQRNPTNIARRALEYYENKDRAKFLNCIQVLQQLIHDKEGYAVFTYDYPCPWPNYEMEPPWYSAMAQGLGLKVYSRAFTLTNDSSFLQQADQLMQAFNVAVDSGGVTYKEGGGWWYEEYAKPGSSRPRVLNGMIYALLGLYDYYKKTDHSHAILLFRKGMHTLKEQLHHYDAGNWSYYDRFQKRAPLRYHKLHVTLLNRLHKLTGEKIFLEKAKKWQRQLPPDNYVVRRVLRSNKAGMTTIFLTFASLFILLETGFYILKNAKKSN